MKTINLLFTSFLAITIAFTACKKEVVNVTGVTLNKTTLSLIVDTEEQLTATVTPSDAEDKSLLWISSDATVVSVNNGLVSAISPGTATVTAKTVDGDFTSVCTVTVTANIVNVTSIVIGSTEVDIKVGLTKQLNTTILPADATNKNITWASSNTSIVTVNSTGLLTGISTGSATITATTEDGAKTATCAVNVFTVGTITEIMTKGFLNTTSSGSGVARGIDITTDNMGVPYIVLNAYDAALSSETKASTEVWKYNGSSWSQFGSSRVEISDDESETPAIAIADDGTVYVAYQYYNSETDPKFGNRVIASSTGGAWSILGNSTNNGLIMSGTSALNGDGELAIKDDGTLLLTLINSGEGYVFYFNDTEDKWKSYNGYKMGTSSFWIGGIDIQTVGNKPYVSVRTSSGDGKIAIRDASETSGLNEAWGWLGSYVSGTENARFQTEEVAESPIAISSTGDIYSCYKTYETIRSRVKKYNGSSWETIYSYNDFGSDTPNEVGVVISNDILYFVFANYNGGIEIHKYNSTTNTWNIEGVTPFIDTEYNIELIAGTNGEFYIAYEATYNHAGKVGVYKYTPAN